MDPFREYNSILKKYIKEETIPLLEASWKEPHRFYHNIDHLNEILEYIEKCRFDTHPIDYDILILSAFFHDAYYQPRNNLNNEDESIKRFLTSFDHRDVNIRNGVIAMIESTKHRKKPKHLLVKFFWEADNLGFNEGYDTLLNNEFKIRKEFNHVPKLVYKKERIKFLKSNLGLFNEKVDQDLNKLIKYIDNNY